MAPHQASRVYLDLMISSAGVQRYEAFIELVRNRSLHNISELEFAQAASKLLYKYPYLVEGLVPFLPRSTATVFLNFVHEVRIRSTAAAAAAPPPFQVQKAKQYLATVRAHFGFDRTNYGRFLAMFRDFRDRTITFQEAVSTLGRLFSFAPEHVEGFSAFLSGERKAKLRLVAMMLRAIRTKHAGVLNQAEFQHLAEESIDCLVFGKTPTSQIVAQAVQTIDRLHPQGRGSTASSPAGGAGPGMLAEQPPAVQGPFNRRGSPAPPPPETAASSTTPELNPRYGASYVIALSAPQTRPDSSWLASVLNETYVALPSGSESRSQDSFKNPHEEAIFRVEDHNYELDVLICRIQSAANALRHAAAQTQTSGHATGTCSPRSARFLRALDPIQRATALMVLESPSILQSGGAGTAAAANGLGGGGAHAESPGNARSVIRRLESRLDELVAFREACTPIWQDVLARSYAHSKDMRGVAFKVADQWLTSNESMQFSIKKAAYRARKFGYACDYHVILSFRGVPVNVGGFPEMLVSYASQDVARASDSLVEDALLVLQHALWRPTDLASLLADLADLVMVSAKQQDIAACRETHDAMDNFLRATLPWLLGSQATGPWPRADLQVTDLGVVFYGTEELYTVIKQSHAIVNRLALARTLATTFQSTRWQFARDEGPARAPQPTSDAILDILATPLSAAAAAWRGRRGGRASPAAGTTSAAAPNVAAPNVAALTSTLKAQMAKIGREIAEKSISWSNVIQWEGENKWRPSSSSSQTPAALPDQEAASHEVGEAAKTMPSVEKPSDTSPPGLKPLRTTRSSAVQHRHNTSSPPDAAAGISLFDLKDPELRYRAFLAGMLIPLLSSSLDQSEYDHKCLLLFGQLAYPLYSVHRIIHSLATNLRKLLGSSTLRGFVELSAARHEILRGLAGPTRCANARQIAAVEAVCLERATAIAVGHPNVFEFRMQAGGDLLIRMVSLEAMASSGGDPGGEPNGTAPPWTTYMLHHLSVPDSCIDNTRRRVFLERNIRNQLPPIVRRFPVVEPATCAIVHRLLNRIVGCAKAIEVGALQCRVDPRKLKMIFVAGSECLLIRQRKRGAGALRGHRCRPAAVVRRALAPEFWTRLAQTNWGGRRDLCQDLERQRAALRDADVLWGNLDTLEDAADDDDDDDNQGDNSQSDTADDDGHPPKHATKRLSMRRWRGTKSKNETPATADEGHRRRPRADDASSPDEARPIPDLGMTTPPLPNRNEEDGRTHPEVENTKT